jgi:hypothetical protein
MESINSMFQWYQDAVECYVFLSDLPAGTTSSEGFVGCKWFTRGWTLQELIAPTTVIFYNQSWKYLGTKEEFSDEISLITNIKKEVLEGSAQLWNESVAARMSWAAHRETTRTEDLAYCLLGIFEVNMGMIYGEGQNAFRRLQEEIVRQSNDLTIFAWNQASGEDADSGIFAQSPTLFGGSGIIEPIDQALLDPEFSLTNKGLKFDNFKLLWTESRKETLGGERGFKKTYALPLGNRKKKCIAVPLRKIGPGLFVRNGTLITISWNSGDGEAVNFYLHVTPSYSHFFEDSRLKEAVMFPKAQFKIQEVVPKSHWDEANSLFFAPVENLKLVLAASGSITLGGSAVQVVVCIDFEFDPVRCRIFNVETHNPLSAWLFRHTRLNYDVTWDDIRADKPEIMVFIDEVEISVDGTEYRISASINKGVVSSISKYSIYSVSFAVQTLSQPPPSLPSSDRKSNQDSGVSTVFPRMYRL